MAAKETQSYNTGLFDSLLLVKDNSPFDYEQYNKTSHYAQDHLDHAVSNTLQKGFNETAKIPFERGDYHLGKLQLTFDVTALSKTSGTYVRLVDFFGFVVIESIRMVYGNVDLIPLINTDDLLVRYLLKDDELEREPEDKLIGANLSQLDRNVRAQAAQSFLVEIPVWWADHPALYINSRPQS